MRAGIENWLLRHWYGTHEPPWYLRMLEPVYRAAWKRAQENDKAARGVYRPKLPLVVVGNITAGGSGKTPLVVSLCRLALDMNIKPGIASTGYGRQSGDTLVVEAGSDTSLCGDEPVLLAKRTGVPVVVAARRRDAVRKLHELDVELIISDDGLQQADLERDIDICVIDGARGTGNGHLLPAGPLRESVDRLEHVDRVVTNGKWESKPAGLETDLMQLKGTALRSLDDVKVYSVDKFLKKISGDKVHAFAGIGNPDRFFKSLEGHGIKFIPHRFADHHTFSKNDFASIPDGATVIMTEKDAVKCGGLGLENTWYLPVDAVLPEAFEDWFRSEISRLTTHRIRRP